LLLLCVLENPRGFLFGSSTFVILVSRHNTQAQPTGKEAFHDGLQVLTYNKKK